MKHLVDGKKLNMFMWLFANWDTKLLFFCLKLVPKTLYNFLTVWAVSVFFTPQQSSRGCPVKDKFPSLDADESWNWAWIYDFSQDKGHSGPYKVR